MRMNRAILTTWLLLVPCLQQRGLGDHKPNEIPAPFRGSYSQSVGIEAPGYRGLEPKLALVYSSEAKTGLAGVGWSLEGFGTIERVKAGRGTPRFDSGDIFLLHSQELVPCAGLSSPGCSAGGSHATKNESYIKILFNSGTNSWTIWGRDGTRTLFSPVYQTSLGTLRWGQTSTIDTQGNTVLYIGTSQESRSSRKQPSIRG
jgi:hypothetical protein